MTSEQHGLSPAPVEAPEEAPSEPEKPAGEWVWARATISLPGLGVGEKALIQRGDPYMEGCLASQFIVLLNKDE